MCSVRMYSKAILHCSWTNLGFISLVVSLGIMQIYSQNTYSFPVYFYLVKSLILLEESHFFYSFIQFILDSIAQLPIRGSNSDCIE